MLAFTMAPPKKPDPREFTGLRILSSKKAQWATWAQRAGITPYEAMQQRLEEGPPAADTAKAPILE